MKHYIIILLILVMNQSYAQEEYQMAEGYYNLSGFELAAGIYLLKNKTFLYSASFGSVDLQIYGKYSISNDKILIFNPNKNLTQEFNVYGKTRKIQNDSIILIYRKPYRENAKKIVVNMGGEKINFPEFEPGERRVSVTFKKSKSLQIGYQNYELPNVQKLTTFEIADSINKLLIFHNYYAKLVKQFVQTSFKMKENSLVYDYQKTIKKKKINKKTSDNIIKFIEKKKNKTTITKDGKVYKKLAPH